MSSLTSPTPPVSVGLVSLSQAPPATLKELEKAAAKAAQDQARSHKSTGERDDLIRRIYANGGIGYGTLAKAAGLTATTVKRIILKGDQ